MEQPRRRWRRLALSAALSALLGFTLYWLARPPRERVEGHAFAVPPVERRIVVEVLNGTRRQGLARTATRILRRQGIDVVFLGNADSLADSTRIIVRRGEPARGRDVAEALGVGRILVAPDTLRRVDVSVILGRDYRPRTRLHP